ncbi:MAG: formate dehydrogenase accessory sulfurtransferase FdhD [Halioglobus sp.]
MPDVTQTLSRKVWRQGQVEEDTDQVVQESPVALVYNGLSHAVMMATPSDLADLALGFSLSEGILSSVEQLIGLDVVVRDQGIEVAMEITAEPFEKLKQRRRSMTGRTGCGLCGVESLEQAILPPRRVTSEVRLSHAALQRGLQSLADAQQLKARTGGVHGAVWCDATGEIRLVREDVGRHNALDKLLGAMVAKNEDRCGFVLLTSRLSYEMVAKAAACNIAVLAAVSAPTALAVEQAESAGMTLVGFVQPGRQVVYSGEFRMDEAKI